MTSAGVDTGQEPTFRVSLNRVVLQHTTAVKSQTKVSDLYPGPALSVLEPP
jgi:hypothetical protein